MQLSDIIGNFPKEQHEQHEQHEKLENEFLDSSKNKNIEIAAGCLYNQLLDFLVYKRSKKGFKHKYSTKLSMVLIPEMLEVQCLFFI